MLVLQQNMLDSLFLGCLQATPSISEVALVDPDMAVAPSLDLWQIGLTTTGVWKVQNQLPAQTFKSTLKLVKGVT